MITTKDNAPFEPRTETVEEKTPIDFPALRNSIISQLLYTGVLFGAFHYVRVRKPELVRA